MGIQLKNKGKICLSLQRIGKICLVWYFIILETEKSKACVDNVLNRRKMYADGKVTFVCDLHIPHMLSWVPSFLLPF